jgi:Nitroreductase family
MGAGGCAGCGGCGCWTGTYYTSPVFGNDAYPPPRPDRPLKEAKRKRRRWQQSTRSKMDDGMRQAIDQVIRTRRSIRRFTDRPVSKQLLLDILDVARRAPSNSNMQPWRIYLAGGVVKDKLAQAISEAHQKSPADYQPERPMYAPDLPVPYSDRLQLFGRVFYAALGIDRADMEARGRQRRGTSFSLTRR